MSTKSPDPTDIHVGSRVRLRRVLVGMSQEKLGEQLGVTFQQVQKYEKGTNRIGASRLYKIAEILGVPINFFYEGRDDIPHGQPGLAESAADRYVVDFIASPDGLQLNKAFMKIRDPRVRRKIVELVRALAAEED